MPFTQEILERSRNTNKNHMIHTMKEKPKETERKTTTQTTNHQSRMSHTGLSVMDYSPTRVRGVARVFVHGLLKFENGAPWKARKNDTPS
jgi:hypothetical protein